LWRIPTLENVEVLLLMEQLLDCASISMNIHGTTAKRTSTVSDADPLESSSLLNAAVGHLRELASSSARTTPEAHRKLEQLFAYAVSRDAISATLGGKSLKVSDEDLVRRLCPVMAVP
jgi:hypothetical protein